MTLPPLARHPRLSAARPTAARIRHAIPAPSAPHNHRAHNPAPSAWTHQARTILSPKSQAPQGGAR